MRTSSIVREESRNERAVFVKQYVAGDWDWTSAAVKERTVREANVISRLSLMPDVGPRLGTLQLVSQCQDNAVVVTEKVPGRPLAEVLQPSRKRFVRREQQRAAWLAGRWLRKFQHIPITPQDHELIGENNPTDLVEYCKIRLDKIESVGHGFSGLSRRLVERVALLVDGSPTRDRGPTLCHCDYSPGNMIWDTEMLTPIDFGMARVDVPLLDVSYFVHRLQMCNIYRPWRPWPLVMWTRAFLRGYGRPDAMSSSMYQAMEIRHLLCRYQTYARRPCHSLKDRLHRRWILERIRQELNSRIMVTAQ